MKRYRQTAALGPTLPSAIVWHDAADVRAGWLFASLPPASEFWLIGERAHGAGVPLALSRGVLVARIEREPDGAWSLTRGTAAGVVRPPDIREAFHNLGFCEHVSRLPQFGRLSE